MAYCFGIRTVLNLCFSTWIHLYMLTSATDHDQTWSVETWMVKTFTAWACMMRIGGLHVSMIWNAIIFPLMLFVVSWLHDQYHSNEYSPTDERKTVRTLTGQKFVKKKKKFFNYLFALTGLVTIVEQRYASTSSIAAPETISNVFCKTDNQRQLECLVNVTYYDPAGPDTRKCFCDTRSSEWDFCGSFIFYC